MRFVVNFILHTEVFRGIDLNQQGYYRLGFKLSYADQSFVLL
jgi:hypothetical protein